MMARLAFVIAFEHAVFVLKFLFSYIIPDVPYSIQLAIKREEYAAKLALELTLYGAEEDQEQANATS